jgi:hypothetical protein
MIRHGSEANWIDNDSDDENFAPEENLVNVKKELKK